MALWCTSVHYGRTYDSHPQSANVGEPVTLEIAAWSSIMTRHYDKTRENRAAVVATSVRLRGPLS